MIMADEDELKDMAYEEGQGIFVTHETAHMLEPMVKTRSINTALKEMHTSTFDPRRIMQILNQDIFKEGRNEEDGEENSQDEQENGHGRRHGQRHESSSSRVTPQLVFPLTKSNIYGNTYSSNSSAQQNSLLDIVLHQLQSGIPSEVKRALNVLTVVSFEASKSGGASEQYGSGFSSSSSTLSSWGNFSIDVGLRDADKLLPPIIHEVLTIVARPFVMEIEDKRLIMSKRGEKVSELSIVVTDDVKHSINISDYKILASGDRNNNDMSSCASHGLFAQKPVFQELLACAACGANIIKNFSMALNAPGTFLCASLQTPLSSIHAISVLSLLLGEWPDTIDEDSDFVDSIMVSARNVATRIHLTNCSYYRQDCSCYNAISSYNNMSHINNNNDNNKRNTDEHTVASKLLSSILYRASNDDDSSDLQFASALHLIGTILCEIEQNIDLNLWKFLRDNKEILDSIILRNLQCDSYYRVFTILKLLQQLLLSKSANGYPSLFIIDDQRVVMEIFSLALNQSRNQSLIDSQHIHAWNIVEKSLLILFHLSNMPHSRMIVLRFEYIILEAISSDYLQNIDADYRLRIWNLLDKLVQRISKLKSLIIL